MTITLRKAETGMLNRCEPSRVLSGISKINENV